MVTIIFILILVTVLNYFYNRNKRIRCEKLLIKYNLWVLNKSDENLSEYRSELESLIKQAGYYDVKIPLIDNVGYGQLRTMSVNPYDQFPSTRPEVYSTISNGLSSSKGVYESRAKYLFNLINWLELLIFLPKYIASYLGFSFESINGKILLIIWWILGTIIPTMILNSYSTEISKFIRNMFSYSL